LPDKQDEEGKKTGDGGVEKETEEVSFEDLFEEEEKKLNLIVKADTVGSLEAVISGLNERVRVISESVGEITESDVELAKTSESLVVGFNVGVSKETERLAQSGRVVVKTYRIIYKLFEEMDEVIKILDQPEVTEKIIGRAEVLADFSNPTHRIAGCKVIEGRIAKNDKIRVLRGEKEVGKTSIKTMRKVKETVDKVKKDQECGFVFNPEVDFKVGDDIIAYKQLKKKKLI